MSNAKVLIVIGSDSDWEQMRSAADALAELGIEHEVAVASAHRTPDRVGDLARGAQMRGIRVIIAGAGAAAALPGVIAAHTLLPVIGVPLASTPLLGLDALLAIVQMPAGIPVATVAVGKAGARNAALFAGLILGLVDPAVRSALEAGRQRMRAQVEAKDEALKKRIREEGKKA